MCHKSCGKQSLWLLLWSAKGEGLAHSSWKANALYVLREGLTGRNKGNNVTVCIWGWGGGGKVMTEHQKQGWEGRKWGILHCSGGYCPLGCSRESAYLALWSIWTAPQKYGARCPFNHCQLPRTAFSRAAQQCNRGTIKHIGVRNMNWPIFILLELLKSGQVCKISELNACTGNGTLNRCLTAHKNASKLCLAAVSCSSLCVKCVKNK